MPVPQEKNRRGNCVKIMKKQWKRCINPAFRAKKHLRRSETCAIIAGQTIPDGREEKERKGFFYV
jgi:hypothetical protein